MCLGTGNSTQKKIIKGPRGAYLLVGVGSCGTGEGA